MWQGGSMFLNDEENTKENVLTELSSPTLYTYIVTLHYYLC